MKYVLSIFLALQLIGTSANACMSAATIGSVYNIHRVSDFFSSATKLVFMPGDLLAVSEVVTVTGAATRVAVVGPANAKTKTAYWLVNNEGKEVTIAQGGSVTVGTPMVRRGGCIQDNRK